MTVCLLPVRFSECYKLNKRRLLSHIQVLQIFVTTDKKEPSKSLLKLQSPRSRMKPMHLKTPRPVSTLDPVKLLNGVKSSWNCQNRPAPSNSRRHSEQCSNCNPLSTVPPQQRNVRKQKVPELQTSLRYAQFHLIP